MNDTADPRDCMVLVLDVAGEERAGLDVPHLLDLFAKHRAGAEEIDDDTLLMG